MKIKSLITFLLFHLLAFLPSKADEGMWTIYNLPQAAFEQMQAEGFQLTYDQLYNGENALKNACLLYTSPSPRDA